MSRELANRFASVSTAVSFEKTLKTLLSLGLGVMGIAMAAFGLDAVDDGYLRPWTIASVLLSHIALAVAHFFAVALVWRGRDSGVWLALGLTAGGFLWSLGALSFEYLAPLWPAAGYLALLILAIAAFRSVNRSSHMGLTLLLAPAILFVGTWQTARRAVDIAHDMHRLVVVLFFLYLLVSSVALDASVLVRRTLLWKRAVLTSLFALTMAQAFPEVFRDLPVGIAQIVVIAAVGFLPLVVRVPPPTPVQCRTVFRMGLLDDRVDLVRNAGLVVLVSAATVLGLTVFWPFPRNVTRVVAIAIPLLTTVVLARTMRGRYAHLGRSLGSWATRIALVAAALTTVLIGLGWVYSVHHHLPDELVPTRGWPELASAFSALAVLSCPLAKRRRRGA